MKKNKNVKQINEMRIRGHFQFNTACWCVECLLAKFGVWSLISNFMLVLLLEITDLEAPP